MHVCNVIHKAGDNFRVGVEDGCPVLLDYPEDRLAEQETLYALGERDGLDAPFLFLIELQEHPEKVIQQALSDTQVDLLKLALEAGGNKCKFVQNASALHGAANAGYIEGVQTILPYMSNPQAALDRALSSAATMNNIGMVRFLLGVGADPNHSRGNGGALSGAIHFGGRVVFKMLLDAGADPNIDDAHALGYAANSGNLTALRTILESDTVREEYIEEICNSIDEREFPDIVKAFTDYQEGIRYYEGV